MLTLAGKGLVSRCQTHPKEGGEQRPQNSPPPLLRTYSSQIQHDKTRDGGVSPEGSETPRGKGHQRFQNLWDALLTPAPV